jgi:hypothetical protein
MPVDRMRRMSAEPVKKQRNWLPLIGLLLAAPAAINYVAGWAWNNQRLDVVAHAFSAPVSPEYADGVLLLRQWQEGIYLLASDFESLGSKEIKDHAPEFASALKQLIQKKLPNEVPYPLTQQVMRLNITNNSSRIFHKLVIRVDRATVFLVQRNEEKPETLWKDGRVELSDVNPKDHFKVFSWGGLASTDYFSVNADEGEAHIRFIPDTDYQSPSFLIVFLQGLSFTALGPGIALILWWLGNKFFPKVFVR